MTAKQQRSRTRLDSIGLSLGEENGLRDLGNDTLLRNGCRQQWEKKTEEEKEAWFVDLASLVKECGIDRVCAGMREAWTHTGHLPSAPDVRKYLPLPKARGPLPTWDSNCAECSGSGWKYVMSYSDLYQREERRATRCDCNTRPHLPRKVADTADAAYITAKTAELDAKFKMPAARAANRPIPLPASARPAIPIVQFTADQIQRRMPMEQAECHRVEEELAQGA